MKRSPIRPVSRKRAVQNRERAKLRPRVVGGQCAARLSMCSGTATDLHEVLPRSQGGSITDLANIQGLCRSCHTYITDHPKWSYDNGWLKHRWSE